jgi:HEAT repeat protein
MIAIQILGDLRSKTAVPFLASLLEKEDDYYIIREVVLSSRKIGNEERMNMIQKLKNHPSELVKRLIEDKQ